MLKSTCGAFLVVIIVGFSKASGYDLRNGLSIKRFAKDNLLTSSRHSSQFRVDEPQQKNWLWPQKRSFTTTPPLIIGTEQVCRQVCSFCETVVHKAVSALCHRHCARGERAFQVCYMIFYNRLEIYNSKELRTP